MEPEVNFRELSLEEIFEYGLDAAEEVFWLNVRDGLTNGDSLSIVMGCFDVGEYKPGGEVVFGEWAEHGRRPVGKDGGDFFVYIGTDDGKLNTALKYRTHSGDAYADHDEDIPDDARRYTGGVFLAVKVKTTRLGWLVRVFAGAASGVQGHFDQNSMFAGLSRAGAVWAMQEQAEHGNPRDAATSDDSEPTVVVEQLQQ